jgi:large subunit ribosomal protein LP0
MRKALRAQDSLMVMGKNTLLKKAIEEVMTEPTDAEAKKKWVARPELQKIIDNLVLNTGMIFTNGDLADVKKILDSQVREAPARIGSFAPADVTIPAGPTGLDPK